jgi:hypothetical protein
MSGALDGDERVRVEHLRVTRHRLHARYVPRPFRIQNERETHRQTDKEREREEHVSEPPSDGVDGPAGSQNALPLLDDGAVESVEAKLGVRKRDRGDVHVCCAAEASVSDHWVGSDVYLSRHIVPPVKYRILSCGFFSKISPR